MFRRKTQGKGLIILTDSVQCSTVQIVQTVQFVQSVHSVHTVHRDQICSKKTGSVL